MADGIKKSIAIYYCSSIDNFIHDINKITYSQLKELLSYNGCEYAYLSFKETTVKGNTVYEKTDYAIGTDKDYLDKLCKWFECDNIKELEMKVKLKRN